MNIEQQILEFAQKNRSFQISDLLPIIGEDYSRGYISQKLGALYQKGLLVRSGSAGRNVRYASLEHADALGWSIDEHLDNVGLEEYQVMDELFKRADFWSDPADNVESIVEYGFTEMLNNAIEHSQTKHIDVSLKKHSNQYEFIVQDYGVGVFRNIVTKTALETELDAIEQVLKGKLTTAPQLHSGQGIFFTSKAADIFVLDSYGYRLRVDNLLPDIFIEPIPPVRGTKVTFIIAQESDRHLEKIFRDYQTDEETFAFDKSEIPIRLYQRGTVYISRSQARRVLLGLEKFRQVILDFRGIPTIGQAFADEVFRVFAGRHPEVTLTPINMNEAVQFMVERVDKPQIELFS